jgi:hypothetical protein
MDSQPRSVAFACAVLAIAGLLGSCDGNGGGSSTQTVYVSMSNYEGCVTAFSRINLLEADAVLLRTDDGSPDCTLAPELASAGCTITFEELNEGATLRAVVTGCRVPEVSNLYSCKYDGVDVPVFNTDAGSSCGCLSYEHSCYVNGICDICASEDADRGDCEHCSNERDDDGDGDEDCDDSDCELTDECGYGRSTITCSTTTTATVTSTSLAAPVSAPMTELVGAHD